MPSVRVCGATTPVTWGEYFCALLPKGTPVEFERRGERGAGIVEYSWFYDGVVLSIDCGGKSVYVFPGLGARVRRVRDNGRLPFVGEGI